MRSSYMKKLFEKIMIATPHYKAEYKGIPLIHINSSAEDAQILLSAVYDRNALQSALRSNRSTLALLEKSAEYAFKDLHTAVLDTLSLYFPTTVDAWPTAKRAVDEYRPFSQWGSLIAFANIAGRAAPHLLPAVLLKLLCQYHDSDPLWSMGRFRQEYVELRPPLKIALMNARPILDDIARTKLYPSIFNTAMNECPSRKSECEQARERVYLDLEHRNINPFNNTLDWSKPWCSTCRRTLLGDWRAGRDYAWEKLPQAFALPEWENLLRGVRPSRKKLDIDVMDLACATQCEELWFPDGTVVLQAGVMRFRVYKGVLAKDSTFFADMFAIPQPAEAESYQGCPLVVIHDSEEDARAFLLALHSTDVPNTLFRDERQTLRLLRMSHKYGSHKLRAAVLHVLEEYFPTDLMNWQLRQRTSYKSTAFTAPGAIIWLVNIAQHAARHLLPAALLALVPFCPPTAEASSPWHESFKNALVKLEPELVLAVTQARDALNVAARRKVYLELFNPSNANCRSPEGCDIARAHALRKILNSDELINPFLYVKSAPGWDPKMFCRGCLQRLEQGFVAGLRDEWNTLPERFGLPEWKILLAQEHDVDIDMVS
ncbi:hypothetical protein PsYK624_068690 [Phanerochaete sordida]|uniref:BTB domain-containing protein n=1 Tax=Phanerochaete sordida TaxID=48140 RepID=A0A9P3GA17_9APHY|nr:hypothetical protein PsYK624_068690 [Phanerochaete sordida]